MATRALANVVRSGAKKVQVRNSSHDSLDVYNIPKWHGKREVVCYGASGEPTYIDCVEYPWPAIRYKEMTPDLLALREKEKGDWKKLSIEDKKTLYRASFRQTFAEMEAPMGNWKSNIGISLIGISMAIWAVVWLKHYVSPPLPPSFSPEARKAQLKRMHLLNMNPIDGLPK
ncbi:hypothetical protein QAD02_016227 [Eretmocerus hayati]|uniref:Uncharacterized protein n=1 Tax=Eretmocerus hayati TaxID=131215 RepID=A0ACC2PA17_9HYME|nr:hypothetical protein QAD02_016227 [Eretmocerus hayati]